MKRWRVTFIEDDRIRRITVEGSFHDLYDYLSTRSDYLIEYSVFSCENEIFTITV